MPLWNAWIQAVRSLRPACKRTRTFLWMTLALVGLCVRADLLGVTSLVRVLRLQPRSYLRFLHFFHSPGLDLDALTALWVRLARSLFRPFQVGPYLVCLADGIKAPKEGRLMPAVKNLHQQSTSNSKPRFIMGHSLQALSLLVRGPAGYVAAIPLVARIHEGIVLTNRDKRTLLDKLVALFFSVIAPWNRKVLLVADAYYASRKIITPLLASGHQLVTRVRSNAVAFRPAPQPERRGRGRPRVYGEKLRLRDLAKGNDAFVLAPSPVYGEQGVMIRYRVENLLWRPVGHLVRFVLVRHPQRGLIFLLATDLTLDPLEIIQAYGYRFKIEVGFRQAIQVLGAYAYHFWMMDMTPSRRGSGNQYLHHKTKRYRQNVARKIRAYHAFVQLASIAQGLLLHLAINRTSLVWDRFRGWLRTMNPHLPPSELVVAHALRSDLPGFLAGPLPGPELEKLLDAYRLHEDAAARASPAA
jgi:hypothetical protein